MDSRRRDAFLAWFSGPPLRGDRSKLIDRTGYSKGRISQFFDPEQAFGERAAHELARRLGLPEDAFDFGPQPPHSGGHDHAQRKVAQVVSLDTRQATPAVLHWETLMQRPIEAEFQTEMPDASMAPDVPRGALVILVAGSDAEPGDFVLVVDRTGRHYLREYRELRPGHWQAHAKNEAFLPLDSERDGLQVVAIFDGIRGRRSRR